MSNQNYPNLMCFGRDIANCPILDSCPGFEPCNKEYERQHFCFDEGEHEFEPGRVFVDMFELNP